MNVHQQQTLFQTFQRVECRAYLEELLVAGSILAIVEEIGQRTRAYPVVAGTRLYAMSGERVVGVDVRCPWCLCRHQHGAGPLPFDGDGHRVAHCTARPRINTGYIIREEELDDDEFAMFASAITAKAERCA